MKLKELHIKGLYKEWDFNVKFHPKVNIISGNNGSFKSTFLRAIRNLLTSDKVMDAKEKFNLNIQNAQMYFSDETILYYRHFDDSLLSLKKVKDDELLSQIATHIQSDLEGNDEKALSQRMLKADIEAFKRNGKHLSTSDFHEECIVDYISTFDVKAESDSRESYLDKVLHRLESDYAYYLSDLAKLVTDAIMKEGSISKQSLDEIYKQNNLFLSIVNASFAVTGKVTDNDKSRLSFKLNGKPLNSDALSSGEKQLLVVLLTVLLQRNKECILLMDEPEISMHFEWQQKLIARILALNPNCQIILASHSPALIMDGWEDYVLSMFTISSKAEK